MIRPLILALALPLTLPLVVGLGGAIGTEPDAPLRLPGDSLPLGEGFVSAWVEVEDGGAPLAVGVTLPDRVRATLPPGDVMLSLDFPEVPGLPFRHVLFDWSARGHPPAALYAHPHWDAHFYLISAEERRAIPMGEEAPVLDPRYMPEGYVPVPALGLFAFPEMGVHWVHEEARELHDHTFDETLIHGSHRDRLIFVEPMFTEALLDGILQGGGGVEGVVPWAEAVQVSGYYPTRYIIRHEPESAAFRISLEGFRWREGG